MTDKHHQHSTRTKLSPAILFGAVLVSGCGQEESMQQTDAASKDPQRIENPQNNPVTDTHAEETDDSVLNESGPAPTSKHGSLKLAIAEIKPASGSDVNGSVSFKPGPDSELMQVEIKLSGLKSDSEHGIHIHESGDCSAADGSSAGGHFNPYNVSHGAPDADAHHAGDMGNVTADAQGEVDTTLSFDFLTFSGPANILDKAVIVHSEGDDLKSDPAGDAGDRVGCGVIAADRNVLISDDE